MTCCALSLLGWMTLVSPSSAGTSQMLAAREAVYRLDVAQRATRAPIVADVYRSVGASHLGFGQPFESSGTATWIEGRLWTNYHVVDNADSIVLVDAAGVRHEARFVTGDPFSDLAIIETPGWSPPGKGLSLAKVSPREGSEVASIGFAGGLAKAYSEGIVTAILGESPRLGSSKQRIWTDALITDGYSGGPLVNRRGDCVGLIHAYGHPDAGVRDMGFAVSTLAMTDLLKSEEGLDKLGITVRGTPDDQGVIVSYVRSGSPASRGGLQRDDFVGFLNGEPVGSGGELREYLRGNPSSTIMIGGARAGEEQSWSIAWRASKNDPTEQPIGERWHGLYLDWSEEEQGLYVAAVVPNSVAALAGFFGR